MSGDIWPSQPVTEIFKGPLGTPKQGSWVNPIPNPGTLVKTINPTLFFFFPFRGCINDYIRGPPESRVIRMTQTPSLEPWVSLYPWRS